MRKLSLIIYVSSLTLGLLLSLSLVSNFTNTVYAQVVESVSMSTATTTVSSNQCLMYEDEPEKMFTDDVFDKETFVGIASTSIKNIPLSYLPLYADASSTLIYGESFDVTAFTPKTWYSHHPTDSTIYVVQLSSAYATNSASTTATTTVSTDFISGERYVIAGTFIKNASSSAWSHVDSLAAIANGSSTSKILLNNSCVSPMKVTQELDTILGKPLVSFDKYNYNRTLGLGMSGDDVKELNILLGVYPRYFPEASTTISDNEGNSHKYFGKQTRTSLINYQQANAEAIGIRVATGFFGERTMAYVNGLQTTNLGSELSCAIPSQPTANSVSSILYDLIPASTTLIHGVFKYGSSTMIDKTLPVDLSYFVNTVAATTTSVSDRANATQLIASVDNSLDVLLSRFNVGSSTQFMPFDSVKQFAKYFNQKSIAEGRLAQFYSDMGSENVFFPKAIACARSLR